MASWNSKTQTTTRYPTKPSMDYPDWDIEDCGCCNGIMWGGEYPRECDNCNGSGRIYRHRESGVAAEYPGGRFVGA